MVAVVQVEDPLEPQDPRHLVVVALVAEHVLADGAGRPEPGGVAHVVVGCADQVAGVAFLDELGDRARGHERDVVGMGLDRQQHLALVRRALGRALEEDLARRFLGACRCQSREGAPASVGVRKSRRCIRGFLKRRVECGGRS